MNLTIAEKKKIRLTIEKGSNNVYQVWLDPDPESLWTVSKIMHGLTWIPIFTKPSVRYVPPVPSYKEIKRTITMSPPVAQFSKRSKTSKTYGKVTIFAYNASDLNRKKWLCFRVQMARKKLSSMDEEIKAIEKVVNGRYYVNISGDKTYLYAKV